MAFNIFKSQLLIALVILGACSSSKSYLPLQVFKGDSEYANVTRGGYHSTFDTAEVASKHCAQYGKMAKLVSEVNVWEFPNTDKYICIKPS